MVPRYRLCFCSVDSHDQRHQARKEATERAIRSSVLPVHTIALTIQFYRLCAGRSYRRCLRLGIECHGHIGHP